MAKNPGRGRNVARRNSVPNVVGQVVTTAQSNLTAAGFDSFVTGTQNTADQNLNDKIVSQSIAAGEVRELGADVNLVKYTFSFSPFGFSPFGFTPFGFTPVFSFIPNFVFTPFNFAPPSCIEENTLIETPNGKVAAKDLSIGDEISSVFINEVPLSGSDGATSFEYMGFVSQDLTITEKITTTIVDIVPSVKNSVIYFNDEESKLFSTSQPVFIKRGSYYEIIPSGAISEGDVLIRIKEDGSKEEVLVQEVNILNGQFNVYQFGCEPADWFIAGDYLVHNKA